MTISVYDLDFLNDLLENIPYYIFWKDHNSVFRGCNKKFANQFGFKSQQEVIGKIDDDFPWADKLRKKYVSDDQIVMQSGIPMLDYEENQKQLDGSIKTLLVSKVPIKNKNNEIIGILGIYADITERKKAEIELAKAKGEAESANQLKTQFIADMEHDLRTPCSGISAMSKILEAQESDAEKKQVLGYLSQASNRLLKILDSILTFEKIESGKYPVVSKEFSIHKVVSEAIAIEMPKAEKKKIKITNSLTQDIPNKLIGDEHRISRIILNLVSNAVKFTLEGYVHVFVKVAEKVSDKKAIIHIVIKDTGIGIPQDKQELVYERFARVKPANSGEFNGTGLGLSIVKRFVEDLQGNIYMESRLGVGTTFTCALPIDFPESNTDQSVDRGNAITAIEPEDIRVLNVLLVEDDVLSQLVAKSILRDSCKVEIDIANNGHEALEFSNKKKYDLILMDIGLPDTDGYMLTQEIRNNKSNTNNTTLIIALTAHKCDDAKKASFKAGMDDFFMKPFNMQKCKIILDRWIAGLLIQESANKDAISGNILPNNRKYIDLELGIQLAGGRKEQAMVMLEVLIKEIPGDLKLIAEKLKANNLDELSKIVHKLRGRACYCGTPGLQKITEQLQFSICLKKSDDIELYYQALREEIDGIVACFEELK